MERKRAAGGQCLCLTLTFWNVPADVCSEDEKRKKKNLLFTITTPPPPPSCLSPPLCCHLKQ